MKWKDPYIEYPQINRWILLIDKDIGITTAKIKSYFVTFPSDPEHDQHIPIGCWPYRFDRYIYMEELTDTLTIEKFHSNYLIKKKYKEK